MLKYISETHQYFYNGKEVPSVNQILKAEGITPDFTHPNAEHKRQLGTYVHKAISLYFENRLDINSLEGEVKDYFNGAFKFIDDFSINPLEAEKILYSEKWGFAGTPDLWVSDTIYDWKVGNFYEYYELTMAGYQLLIEEHSHKIDKIVTIHLSPNNYKLKDVTPDRQNFLALLKTYQYKQKRGLYE